MLKFHQVGLKISQNMSLKDVDLAINLGDRLALVGPTGSGKTTLLRLANKLISPTSGHLTWRGQAYLEIPAIMLRRQVVLAMQEPKLLDMNVSENLAYPLILQKVAPAAILSRLEYWRSRMEIPREWSDRTASQLSLGQQQWVSLTRALVMQPKVLLLDEPTSALDMGRINHLLEVFAEIGPQSAIVLATHQLDVAAQFAQQVAYLNTGCIEFYPAAPETWQILRTKITADSEADDLRV